MAAKKKTTAKPAREKRPSRQHYTVFDPTTGKQVGPNYDKRKDAKLRISGTGLKVAGPYVLAERAGQD